MLTTRPTRQSGVNYRYALLHKKSSNPALISFDCESVLFAISANLLSNNALRAGGSYLLYNLKTRVFHSVNIYYTFRFSPSYKVLMHFLKFNRPLSCKFWKFLDRLVNFHHEISYTTKNIILNFITQIGQAIPVYPNLNSLNDEIDAHQNGLHKYYLNNKILCRNQSTKKLLIISYARFLMRGVEIL